MTLDNNDILLLNPLYEKSHIYDNGEIMVKYQHGNLSVSWNTMSIIFLFRVVDEYCIYDTMTNSIITTTSPIIQKKGKVIICEKLYESFDHIQYHKDINSLYSSVIVCNKY